ncbi:transporter substrate-binding domain-containing protein [Tateyamaria omphalii]|uniref:Peptidoglycan-binding protein LysM n=1 Tax=Tateyamaria omphalii TaxID=299262 RepID=A0A1P8MSI1_9RHOB|nr:transporter substrate-binding domain-containing protein [Tateyamaria omphalii]APX11036.1 peptidoglycan-binding protein LysM [Tateyamaria omphalii]
MKRFLGAAALVLAASATTVAAQACGGFYTVKRGDSLSLIADRQYKNAATWTEVHRNNLSVIGENPNALRVGMQLRLGCIDGLPVGLPGGAGLATPTIQTAATPTRRRLEQSINIVTAGDFAPFTDQTLENEGLITDVVRTAMQSSQSANNYRVHWVNDWSSHLDPLMSNAMMDMAFPWYKPDCAGSPDNYRCTNFHFSDPMFEMLILLFVDKTRPIPFAQDSDIEGRTLCRPAGYFTHDLDRADRRWISDAKITLKQPQTVKGCFDMLVAGEVDAVAMNEFTGRAAIKDLGLKDQVEVVQGRPISIEGLHVLVHKDHPQADALLSTINGGLDAIKLSGEYQQIIDRHMSKIWAAF